MVDRYDHKLPFHVDVLMPRFSYHPHSSWVQLTFAIIIGLVLAGFLAVGYFLLF